MDPNTHLYQATPRGRRLLTVTELAQTLGVHANTVRRRVWREELPAVRIGARMLFDWPAVARTLGIEGADDE